MKIREMIIDDYEEVFSLWQITSKRALNESDSKEGISAYLERNKGLSQVAIVDGKIVGTVLAGHDGRNGFIHHMAVLPEYRRNGIAADMAKKAINALNLNGIKKTYIYTYTDNNSGQCFWSSIGFKKYNDVFVFMHDGNIN